MSPIIRWVIKMNFSEEQRKAINSDEPFLFLQACAGSGKTRVIVEKVKRLIFEGVNPEDILCITFTKKASIEMAERLENRTNDVYTFHQFCLNELKKNTVYPYDIFEPDDFSFSPYELLMISRYKNSLYRIRKPNSYSKYQMVLKSKHLKDFDDLLIDYLKSHISENYSYLFIDEFQDTNELQYQVLKKLISCHTKVFAVGDPNQSIYRFRGSNYKIIHQFVHEYKASVLTLSTNYRSTKPIVHIANQLIINNPKRDYLSMNPSIDGYEDVESISFYNLEQESLYVTDLLISIIQKNSNLTTAILYRNHKRAFHLKNHLYELDDYRLQIEDTIHFLTIHQSKGLEFDVVVMIGLEQGELPSLNDNQMIELEEERRLCFVGMTRAKKKLILTHVRLDDQRHIHTPSVFLKESHVKTHDYMPIK